MSILKKRGDHSVLSVLTMWRTCLVCVLTAVLLGCTASSDKESLKDYRERAQTLVEQQQFREAAAVYQDIIRLNPKDDEAHYQLALLHLVLSEPEDISIAEKALLKVVKLSSSRADAHLKLGHLYLAKGDFAAARLHVDAILTKEPAHSEAHVIRGMSYVYDGQVQKGTEEFRKAIDSDPQNGAAHLEMANAHVLQRNFPEAESHLREVLKIDPQSIDARIAFGDLYSSEGKESEAVKEYLRALELDSQNEDVYTKLASLSMAHRRFGEAERYYLRWVEAAPSDEDAHMALSDFYRATGRLREAVSLLQRAREGDPSSRTLHKALITLYLEATQVQEAGREIDLFLRQNGKDADGRILQARLVLEQGDSVKALQLLQQLALDIPNSAEVQHNLGMALASRKDFERAIYALKNARNLDPESLEIRVSLAQVYLAHGAVHSAVNEGESILEGHPQQVPVQKLLVEAHLLGGEVKRAHELLRDLQEFLPDDVFVHHRLGVVSALQRRPTEAMAHFEQALARAPGLIEALEEVAAILIAQGNSAQAYERVAQQVALNPHDSRFHNLLGRVLSESRRFSEAEAAFKKAKSLDGMQLANYIHLGELYIRQGKAEQAIKEFEANLTKSAERLQSLMILGLFHEQRKDYAGAMARYEEALRIDPKFGPAANNLAWIIAEHLGDTERALSYADTARQALPHDPYVADTLGWIYYRKQMYAKSVSLLKEAADHVPMQPRSLYHYGIAQFANKQRDQARKALNKFLTLSPNDPHAQEVKKVLAELT